MTNNFAANKEGAPAQAGQAPAPDPDDTAADARFDLILLDPAEVRLFRTGGSVVRLELSDPQVGAPRSYVRVTVARAFPLSDPDHYIGLRDGKDQDIGMLRSLDGLDADSRALAEEELTRRYFLPKILRVNDVKEEFGITTWDVETDKGPRTFNVRHMRDAVQSLTPTRVLVTDSEGNRWEFPDVRTLDDKSYEIIQRVL
jgi:hypothetical protein